jgi:hypothetical protein
MAPGPLRGLTRKQSKVFPTDVTQHVVNVSGERDGGVDEMGPLARPVSVGVWTSWPARRSNY